MELGWRFVARQCNLASWAYAAAMKRLGRGYYGVAVAALYVSAEHQPGAVVFTGVRPGTLRRSSRSTSAASQ